MLCDMPIHRYGATNALLMTFSALPAWVKCHSMNPFDGEQNLEHEQVIIYILSTCSPNTTHTISWTLVLFYIKHFSKVTCKNQIVSFFVFSEKSICQTAFLLQWQTDFKVKYGELRKGDFFNICNAPVWQNLSLYHSTPFWLFWFQCHIFSFKNNTPLWLFPYGCWRVSLFWEVPYNLVIHPH